MRTLRCGQTDGNTAVVLRGICSWCILAAVFGLAATDASANVRSDIEITKATIWKNEVKQVSGRIRVRDGASLTLINSTITFNCTFDNQYGIMVDGTGELLIKKSVIDTKKQGDGKYYGWFLLAGSRDRAGKQTTIAANGKPVGDGTRYWMYKLIGDLNAKTLIQIEDSHLRCIGNKGSSLPDKGICIWFWKVRTGSYVKNTFFDNTMKPHINRYPRGGAAWIFRHLGYIEVRNNTFKNFYAGIVIYKSGYAADKFLPIEGNKFIDVAMDVHTHNTRKLRLKNNYYCNNFSRYCINIWGGPTYDKEIYICGEYEEKVARPLVFNIRVSDVLVEKVTQKQINSCLVGMNKYIKRMVVRHLTGDDLYYIVDGAGGGRGNTDNHFYDITVTNARYGGVQEDAGSRATFSDCRFSGRGNGEGIRVWHPECTYSNITLNKFATGIELSKAKNCLFRDIVVKGSRSCDISFKGSNSKIVFINVKYDPNKVRFSENKDVFRPSYYCDVKVVDAKGKPIEGAVVKISNEVDQSIGAINRLGKSINIFRTGKDGHTPLPLPYKSANLKFAPPIKYDKDGNPIFPKGGHKLLPLATDSKTIVLTDHTRTKSGLKNYTYTIEVEKKGYKPGKVIRVDPDSSWYRADPAKPPVTIRVTLK